MTCNHKDFETKAQISMYSDKPGGPVVRYAADVTIKCTGCGQFFEFIGVPQGSPDIDKPTLSLTKLELHVPIQPQGGVKLTRIEDQPTTNKGE